jgi:hypothetical protein
MSLNFPKTAKPAEIPTACKVREADGGVGRGPGVHPTNFADCGLLGNESDFGSDWLPHERDRWMISGIRGLCDFALYMGKSPAARS